jgi:chorismate mutase
MDKNDIQISSIDTSWVSKKPFIIAGPCSAESEEQILQTARELSKINAVSVFRAGIWKPRSRPNDFNGVGSVGLSWLEQVKRETGLPIAVEVGMAHHVEESLEHGVDILWVGARTTGSPFSIENIANALRGVDVTVLVKNPPSPDLDLWIGALERLSIAGIKKLAAVHRGFSPHNENKLRCVPKWEVCEELRKAIPQLPILCDPSHISGDSKLVPEIAKEAFKIGFDGFMIEAHINPAAALSDAFQQLSPKELMELLIELR